MIRNLSPADVLLLIATSGDCNVPIHWTVGAFPAGARYHDRGFALVGDEADFNGAYPARGNPTDTQNPGISARGRGGQIDVRSIARAVCPQRPASRRSDAAQGSLAEAPGFGST